MHWNKRNAVQFRPLQAYVEDFTFAVAFATNYVWTVITRAHVCLMGTGINTRSFALAGGLGGAAEE